MRQTMLLFALVFLAGCMLEKPASAATPAIAPPAPERGTADVVPAITPSVFVEQCARGDSFDEIESGGQTRRYLLHVPAGYSPEEPSALVLVFHGAGIGAERFVAYSRFSKVADREGFLVVYPQGWGDEPFWNPAPGSRDVQFVRDLIEHLQKRCRVDADRIFASGHSNGGGMVDRLACELADQIAAIGTISGAYPRPVDCSPARPVPVFAIHGTADPIVPYTGIPEWAAAWAQRNGCDHVPVDIAHNVLIGERRWGGCREGAEVILYSIQGLEHDWTHDLIDMGQTLWEFFEGHPRDGGQ